MTSVKSAKKTAKKKRPPLKRGRFYFFSPIVKLTKVSAVNACEMADNFFLFSRGKYIGKRSNKYLFEGTPDNDTRKVYNPLRNCSFFVSLNKTTLTLSG